MKRILFMTLLVGCTGDADIGITGQPVKCQPNAAGDVNGTVTNPQTHASFQFGTPTVSITNPTQAITVALDDSTLALQLQFYCGQPGLGEFNVGNPDRTGCPLAVGGTVSGNLQQIYALGHSGTVIVDENVGCLAGRYDIAFGSFDQTQTFVDQGELAGWFSIPTN